MRVLITWGSKRGGTEGIARTLGEALAANGHEARVLAPREAMHAKDFDAVIVGGALYANRWHRDARRFVNRRLRDLQRVPVWFFSSGPLDDSATKAEIPPTTQVQVLMERVGAQGHVTFGGRLAADAKGFPASAMVKTNAGDWRSPEHIRRWALEVANALPLAKPLPAVVPKARSVPRLLLHALVGWALCAATMGLLLAVGSLTVALVVHAIAAPIFFALVSRHYFAGRGAREPLTTALVFTGVVAALDLLVVAGAVQRSLEMFTSIAGTWLPFALIFLTTWATGTLMSTMPWETKPPAAHGAS